MTIKELLDKAIYIQFPYINKEYRDRYRKRKPVKVPKVKDYDPLYSDSVHDTHHYTTKYHRRVVLPLLESLYKFGYNKADFDIVKFVKSDGDYSYMVPKKDMRFDVYRYDLKQPKMMKDVGYMDLFSPTFKDNVNEHRYWGLYRYPHACSRIINKSLPKDGRKLFISGDSQMIPDIPVLACYFREVWYFDNRTGYKTSQRDKFGNYTIKWIEEKHLPCMRHYEKKTFTDVLMQTYCADLERYEKWNLV